MIKQTILKHMDLFQPSEKQPPHPPPKKKKRKEKAHGR